MNTYDQLALSAFPTLYVASPLTTDQSNSSEYTLSNNSLSLTGQPIISGHLSSFYVNDTNTVDIGGDLGFFISESSLEFVMYCNQPQEEFPLLMADSLSGIYVDQDGIIFRLHFQDTDGVVYAIDAKCRVEQWSRKFHIILYFNSNDAQLLVNGNQYKIDYIHEPVIPTEFVLGTTEDNWVNIDGFSAFNRRSPDKSIYINDLNNGHAIYSTAILGGNYTMFDSFDIMSSRTYNKADFIKYDQDQYILTTTSPPETDSSPDFVIIKININNTNVVYKTDLSSDWNPLNEPIVLDNSTPIKTISFIWTPNQIVSDISITIDYIRDGKIEEHSPAILELTGQALFFDTEDSMVNVPNGIRLIDSYYEGTWVVGNNVDIPLSIEILFKAETIQDDTYVFYSSDGHASFGPTGSISGYIAYLNGQLVTDLDDVLVGQIYHLVLIESTPAGDTFYLNFDGSSSSSISYILLSSYQTELSENQILSLLNVLSGSDKLEFEETIDFLDEGTDIDTGIAYNPYSYAWSIVGAGGH
jgi:hypothetical protein